MSKPLPRTRINSSRLVRLLAELSTGGSGDSGGPAGPPKSFAERLGQWLNLTDAIALSGALNAGPVAAGASARADEAEPDELAEFARVRAALSDSIMADGLAAPAKARIKLPAPEMATDPVTGYTPYHRYYLAHQRDLEAAVAALRAKVRQALARRSAHSPELGRLAALDAVLEKALGDRERSLLATVPELLARRFEQLRAAHRQARDEAASAPRDDPQSWMQPGGWLAAFCQDLRTVLLAELDIRLQPVAGLVDAYNNAPSGETATPPAAAGANSRGGDAFFQEVTSP
jgi:hypothetical protein